MSVSAPEPASQVRGEAPLITRLDFGARTSSTREGRQLRAAWHTTWNKQADRRHGRLEHHNTGTGNQAPHASHRSHETIQAAHQDVGSQYLVANLDAHGDPLDGARTYRVRLSKDIPAARFWSFTVYDNQSRSTLQTPQRYPRDGSQTYPSPAAGTEPDGSTLVYFSPTQPDNGAPGNWIQTDPAKGWFTLLRLYSPLQSFFDKTWRPGELELVRWRAHRLERAMIASPSAATSPT